MSPFTIVTEEVKAAAKKAETERIEAQRIAAEKEAEEALARSEANDAEQTEIIEESSTDPAETTLLQTVETPSEIEESHFAQGTSSPVMIQRTTHTQTFSLRDTKEVHISAPAQLTPELIRQLTPVIETAVEKAIAQAEERRMRDLYPMVRNAVRRAIAEQIPSKGLFRSSSSLDEFGWRLKALISSRSYDDVLFEKTNRFQVVEAYLFGRAEFSMRSFASTDPKRHSAVKSIAPSVSRIAELAVDPETRLINPEFAFNDGLHGVIREGRHCFLVGIVRGKHNPLVQRDLDFILHELEEAFGDNLELRGTELHTALQPILEGCLLIQSPANPSES